MSLRSLLRKPLRRFGLDVVRYPTPGSLGAHLKLLIQRLGIDCVFDVGAHRGEYGRFLRRLGYRGVIHSFEPSPSSYVELLRILRSDHSWVGHAVALGSRNAERELQVMRGTDFNSFRPPSRYARERFPEATEVEDRVPVPVRRLDEVVAEIDAESPLPESMLLKIDTQGSEEEVLEGATGCLQRVAVLQLELPLKGVYDGVPALWEMLPRLLKLDFEVTGFFPLSRERSNLALIEVDCVLVRRPPVEVHG